jgi:hypothetical protein
METSVFISIMDEKDKKVLKFIKKFCKFHNKKRHKGKDAGAHSAKTINNRDLPYIVIPVPCNNENGHMIKTMADVIVFLEENPEFMDIWEEGIEIEGRLV